MDLSDIASFFQNAGTGVGISSMSLAMYKILKGYIQETRKATDLKIENLTKEMRDGLSSRITLPETKILITEELKECMSHIDAKLDKITTSIGDINIKMASMHKE